MTSPRAGDDAGGPEGVLRALITEHGGEPVEALTLEDRPLPPAHEAADEVAGTPAGTLPNAAAVAALVQAAGVLDQPGVYAVYTIGLEPEAAPSHRVGRFRFPVGAEQVAEHVGDQFIIRSGGLRIDCRIG